MVTDDLDLLTKPRYAVISTETRRDSAVGWDLFNKLDVIHFYRSAALDDMAGQDFMTEMVHYTTPRDLVTKLRNAQPDVIQTLEPICLVNIPYLVALGFYLRSVAVPLVFITQENLSLVTSMVDSRKQRFCQLFAGLLVDHKFCST